MRVLMLGWEFPPVISGGLGVACRGLTQALSRREVDITFVLPRPVDARSEAVARLVGMPDAASQAAAKDDEALASSSHHMTVRAVNASAPSVYCAAPPAQLSGISSVPTTSVLHPGPMGVEPAYGPDLMAQIQRYAHHVLEMARHEKFDLVHAHDWVTFPAALSIAAAMDKPIVLHVHSTEHDRSGSAGDPRIHEIEKKALHAATVIIAVSERTRRQIRQRYGVTTKNIAVVHNGADHLESHGSAGSVELAQKIHRDEKLVLFLGRVTRQKGPEYFVDAAKLVLQKEPRTRFVMAGSGDRIADIIDQVAEAGLGSRVLFTGFLHGPDVQRIMSMADVYVMPSVSEPFGLTPLEAVQRDLPVIVSKSAGVSEVLHHALHADFWNVRDLADKILAVLRHPPLSSMLREQADIEVRKLTWDEAASKVQRVYERAMQMHAQG